MAGEGVQEDGGGPRGDHPLGLQEHRPVKKCKYYAEFIHIEGQQAGAGAYGDGTIDAFASKILLFVFLIKLK